MSEPCGSLEIGTEADLLRHPAAEFRKDRIRPHPQVWIAGVLAGMGLPRARSWSPWSGSTRVSRPARSPSSPSSCCSSSPCAERGSIATSPSGSDRRRRRDRGRFERGASDRLTGEQDFHNFCGNLRGKAAGVRHWCGFERNAQECSGNVTGKVVVRGTDFIVSLGARSDLGKDALP